jgi:two-component system, sensor histidine kinase
MSIENIDDPIRLKRINEALIARVERSMDQQGNAFTLFQTAINLESRVRAKTDELKQTLRRLEHSNRELSVAKEAAETANASKTRFIAAASHDVLQPLNAARLSISALSEMHTTKDGGNLIRQVERSLDTMEELLRTLLDISRLDAGVMKPEVSSFALADIFDSLESDFQPLAEKARVRLRVRRCDVHVTSDRMMLRRILQNILSNALRYTREGGVLIAARKRGEAIRIDIVDSGIGIAKDQFALVFEEFHRGPEAATSHSGGLGLGLSIVQRMTQALGHPLELSSILGTGTAFRLTLPLATGSHFEPVQPVAIRAENPVYGLFSAKVLLIENDQAVQDAMSTLLSRWNCNVRTAASMGDALVHLSGTGWVPDIIIADQHLNRGTLGSDTILEARKLLKRLVPAIVVTADPSKDILDITRANRIELMHKPVRPAELRALMAHMLA